MVVNHQEIVSTNFYPGSFSRPAKGRPGFEVVTVGGNIIVGHGSTPAKAWEDAYWDFWDHHD